MDQPKPAVTPANLRQIAREFEASANYCLAKGWPALYDRDNVVAACLKTAADIMERTNGAAEKPAA